MTNAGGSNPIDQVALVLLEVLRPRPDWARLSFALSERLKAVQVEGTAELVWPFEYSLTRDGSESREQRGEFVPRYGDGQTTYPPALSSVPQPIMEAWVELSARVPDPIVVSRIADLLWVRRASARPHERARAAIDAYLKLQAEPWQPMYKCEALTRALELTIRLKDAALRNQIGERCLAASRDALARHPYPGPLMMLLRALVNCRVSQERPDVEEVIREAETKYARNPDIFEKLKDLEVAVQGRTPERLREAQREKAAAWKAYALRATGIGRLSFLERALERAREGGLTSECDELLRLIQGMSTEDLGLTRFEFSVEVPAEIVRALDEHVLAGGDSWQTQLDRFGLLGPPSGDPAGNLEIVKRIRAEAPLSATINRGIIGTHNAQLRHSETEEDRLEFDLIETEVRNITFSAVVFPVALHRIFSGREASLDDLTAYFTTPVIKADLAERFGKALLLFLRHEYDEALHVAMPRVEATFRELVRQSGGVVIREPNGPRPGGVVGLGDMLQEVKGKIDEGWRRYFRALLSEPLGLNLRNNVAHGLLVKGDAGSAAMVLHVACHLRNRTPGGSPASAGDGPGAES